MPNIDWSDVLISDAVADSGATRDIRLPAMVPHIAGAKTSYRDQVRADVLRAVGRGELVAGPVDLLCPAGHVAWSGPAEEAEAARPQGCRTCSAPGELLLVEETFRVPDAVAREVASLRARPGARA